MEKLGYEAGSHPFQPLQKQQQEDASNDSKLQREDEPVEAEHLADAQQRVGGGAAPPLECLCSNRPQNKASLADCTDSA